jgi:TetR/AcrR family transcriptional regulator, regulator of autoinduction and epiphytic fitness
MPGQKRNAGRTTPIRAKRRNARVDPRLAETRRLVKDATLDLIAEVGFEGTTIELIAERSGVSRTTIYRHWPDPAVLYIEAFDPPSDDREPPSLTGDIVQDLRAYIQHVADRLNDERFAAALTAQIDKARRDHAYRQAHLQYAIARNEHGVNVFRAGIASGQLRPDVNPEHETDLILGYLVYQRLVRHRVLDKDLVDTLHCGVIDRCLDPRYRGRTVHTSRR